MPRAIQTFEVSLKAAIFRNGELLILQEADTGFWELPGGRIDVGEECQPHAHILTRELVEELGAGFTITHRSGVLTWVRQRPTDNVYQFVCARIADHCSGEPALSAEHQGYRWTTPTDWPALTFPDRSGYRTGLQQLWNLAHPSE